MKILHFVQGYHPAIGGTEFLIQKVSEKLVENHGDEVTVFTSNAYNCEGFKTLSVPLMHPGEELINRVKVKRFPIIRVFTPIFYAAQKIAYRFKLPYNDAIRTLYDGPIIFGMTREMARFDGDITAGSSFPLMHMYYATIAKKISGKPLVLHGGLHVEDDWGFNRRWIYKAIEVADAYIANTAFEKDHLVRKGVDERKIWVVGVGVDPEKFINEDGRIFRAKYGLNSEPVVTFLGQQGGHKGIDTLLQAMGLVWKKIPSAKLVIAGARTNFSTRLDNIIESFDDEEQAKIIRIDQFKEEEKPEILAACDIFASPSGYESFGITFLEAWAAGKPVVGCHAGAIPTVISNGENGLLVSYRDAPGLAAVLIELILDEKLRHKLAARGREKVLSGFTWDIIAAKFRQVYETVA